MIGERTTRERLGDLLVAARVLSPTQFAVGDEQPLDLVALGLVAPHDTPNSKPMLLSLLTGHLYNLAYVRTWPDGAPTLDPMLAPGAPDAALVERLTSSRSQPRFEPGWVPRAVAPDGSAVFDKAGRTRMARADEWTNDVGQNPSNTARLQVPFPHPDQRRTFLFVYGATLGDSVELDSMVRIYLHTRPEAVTPTLGWLCDELDRREIPFTLKTLLEPAVADRSDATVLYVSRRYHRRAVGCVRDLPDGLLDRLGSDTPFFTLRLHPGVGLAEDPSTGESFGMHRMSLIATGLIEAFETGPGDHPHRQQCVEAAFEAAGIDLAAPHLKPGSRRDYHLDWGLDSAPGGRAR